MNELLAELLQTYKTQNQPVELPSQEQMAKMPWEELYQLRSQNPGKAHVQENVAPYEHRAWAREAGDKGVMNALTTGLVLSPGYQGVKALGLADLLSNRDSMTTPASWEQVKQSAIGGFEGAGNALRGYLPKALK